MPEPSLSVVKVGGSLYAWPELGPKLRALLAELPTPNVLLIPGGGATADAIRAYDRVHQLGAESSHWLAIAALSVNARFLQRLLPEAPIVTDALCGGIAILDPAPFFEADERKPAPLPHCWQVSSDSLAVRVAVLLNAGELILLKSVPWHGDDWAEAAAAGVVDAYFTQALKQAPADMRVRVENLRA